MSTTKLEWYVGNGEKEFIKKKLVREHSSRKVCFLSALNSKRNWWIEKWTNEQQLMWKPFKEQPTAFNYISIWKFSRAAVFFCCSNFELSPCEHSEHSDGWLILDWNISYLQIQPRNYLHSEWAILHQIQFYCIQISQHTANLFFQLIYTLNVQYTYSLCI